jgi:hypothetical protein
MNLPQQTLGYHNRGGGLVHHYDAAVAASIGTAGGSKLRGEELGGERVFRVESINIDQTPVASSHCKAW